MKLNFSAPILDLKGNPVKEGDADLTLGTIVSRGLLANHPELDNASGDVKAKRFRLALKVFEGGEQEVSAEDLTDIKLVVGKMFTPLAVGRIYEMIEGCKS